MPGRKGNRNALKHGLYASHYTPDIRPELASMPTDEAYMELAAARLSARRALDLYHSSVSSDEKARAIALAISAIQSAVNIICKVQLLSGDAPILQDLWEAIAEANRLDGIDEDV